MRRDGLIPYRGRVSWISGAYGELGVAESSPPTRSKNIAGWRDSPGAAATERS